MPQLTPVVLKDGQATPANHTFAPRDIVGGVATLTESTGVPVGDSLVSVALTRTAQGRRKVTMKLSRPVVQNQVINGVAKPAVVRAGYADITMSFDATSDVQERKDILALTASLLGNDLVKSVVSDLQGIY